MPDTNSFLVLGLLVVFGVSGVYAASLFARFRSAEAMARIVEHLRNE
jgi:hypothetical protein